MLRGSDMRWVGAAVAIISVAASVVALLAGPALADPSDWAPEPPPGPGETYVPFADPIRNDDSPAPLLPVFTPTPSNWAAKYPYPFEEWRDQVTPADITAEAELCQWYNAQFEEVRAQTERLNMHLITANGDWAAPSIPEQATAVTANLDRSLDFITPRVQAFTIGQDYLGGLFFPLYGSESFYRLWQQMSNVRDGIKARMPAWHSGPSFQQMMRFGSKIDRQHVCD